MGSVLSSERTGGSWSPEEMHELPRKLLAVFHVLKAFLKRKQNGIRTSHSPFKGDLGFVFRSFIVDQIGALLGKANVNNEFSVKASERQYRLEAIRTSLLAEQIFTTWFSDKFEHF